MNTSKGRSRRADRRANKFVYKGADTQASRMDGAPRHRRIARHYLSEKIWQPMGMEHDAFWHTDAPGPDGMEAAIHLSQRDTARLRPLRIHVPAIDGKWNGKQIVPADLDRRRDQPEESAGATRQTGQSDRGLAYGYQWWTFPDGDAYSAEGIFFQFIFVKPEVNLVIVKTSAFDRPWDPD